MDAERWLLWGTFITAGAIDQAATLHTNSRPAVSSLTLQSLGCERFGCMLQAPHGHTCRITNQAAEAQFDAGHLVSQIFRHIECNDAALFQF